MIATKEDDRSAFHAWWESNNWDDVEFANAHDRDLYICRQAWLACMDWCQRVIRDAGIDDAEK